MADDNSKSILLQVAFKKAADNGATMEEVENLTGDYFNILIGMHDKLGIVLKDREYGNRGGGQRTAKPASRTDGEQGDGAPVVTIEGDDYFDYRAAKAAGTKPERWPDFKKVGDRTNKGSEWLVDKDGVTPTPFAKLVATAGV